jgi:VCBS repeat-containing protein
MTNHNPTFTGPAATGSFNENANTTDSSALHTLSGLLSFKDSDHTDTHTTSAALRSAAWSSGHTVPSDSLTDFTHALASTIVSDSNGSGQIRWSFAAPDSDFDFLASGEHLVLTYNVTVADNHGGTATQTVTVNVTGSEDRPVISIATPVSVSEQAGHTLSLSPDTAHVALGFSDPDLDNHHTATVIGATAVGNTSGLLPGGLRTAELMAFYHVDNIVEPTATSDGTINTTFSAPDLAFDYLAAGETVTIDYTVQLDDHAGGVTTQDVAVTVTGTNDAPTYLSGPQSAHFTEGQAATLHGHGDLFFADVDLSDTHVTSTSVVSATRSSGQPVPLTNAQLAAALATSLEDSTGHALGEVDWDFTIANNQISFLGNGETLTVVYDVNVTDPSGATATQTVTVTILGTNSAPVFTSGPDSASLTEQADTTGSASLDTTPTGTLTFTDTDTGDTHTVSTSLASAVWSGGSTVPSGTVSAAQTALATMLNDSTGTGAGSVDWTFGIADNQLDFLADGEMLTLTYNVRVSDASDSATQTVTVTVTGTNDVPVITSGPESGSVAEQANTTNSPTPDSANGTLQFSDVDLSNSHTVQVSLDSATWSGGAGFPDQTMADLSSALATTLHDSSGSGNGTIDWAFSIPDRDLDFLSAGETLTATYDVTVSDGTTTSTQTVTIVMNGADDPLVLSPVTAAVTDNPYTDAGNIVSGGSVLAGRSGDIVAPTITAVDGDPANVGQNVAGTYGTLIIYDNGTYSYTANSALDALQSADTPADVFNFTATDSHGQSVTTTLTFNITGGDDNPIMTAADASGSMTEDAGPTVLVNGGFETGDLSGWSTSGTHISVQQFELGGQFGHYTALLAPLSPFAPPGTTESLSQDILTTPGQRYTVSFTVLPDADASSNSFSATWDGQPLLAVSDLTSGGFTHYTFDVAADGTNLDTLLTFTYATDGSGFLLDGISVTPDTGPQTESADGTIHFSDVETGDTHTANFTAQPGSVGTFSLDPVGESGGTGSVDWHFTVDNSDIQFLSQGETLTQVYQVNVSDNHGGTTEQDVTITILGTNDAPSAAPATIVTDADLGNLFAIPGWALATYGSDPDHTDNLTLEAAGAGSGGTADSFAGNAFFTDSGTLGGSFTYTLTDGHGPTSIASATATVDNHAASTTTLTGTSGADIIIAQQGTESLNGGGGNDVLIGHGGAHSLTGGSGDDIFAFLQTTDGPDTITDFNNTTQHDLIAISANGFGSGLTAGMDVTPFFETSGDDQLQSNASLFHFDTANNTLYFSPDGSTASAIALTEVQPGVTLGAADIRIVT